MSEQASRGVGKCRNSHIGSYGFPTRPENQYGFCPQCGEGMVWTCGTCNAPLPDDPAELETAQFCRQCGSAYFQAEP